jgi:secreted Zn-dependent insulinase-like peptidase
LLFSPEPVRAERGAVCLDLLVNCINQLMMEDTYPAALAQLSFACYSGERGLMIKASHDLSYSAVMA